MKIWLGTASNDEQFALHELGEVSVMSQSVKCNPDELPIKEMRTMVVRVAVFEQTYQQNYDLVEQIREQLKSQLPNLKVQEDDRILAGPVTVTGQVLHNREVSVVSHDLPDDPNAWGTYHQQLTIGFQWEENDLVGVDSPHMPLTFQKTGGSDSVTLGAVITFKKGYKSTRYSELRNLRERSTGTITATGEIQGNTEDTLAARRADLQAKVLELENQVNGKDGTLQYGSSANRFFDGLVKVDDLTAEIDQSVKCIRWSMTVSYTIFPDEDGYAAADFTVSVVNDQENGDVVLTMSGRIAAATLALATSKLASVRTASLAAKSFVPTQATRLDTSERNIDGDDGASFIELSFTETYRKRATSILNWKLNVSDSDDTNRGLISRSYSGQVVASGADADAAYAAAVAQAQTLGDNKHPMRMSGKVTRSDRKLTGDTQEHVSVEFSYEYLLKGERIYVEVQSKVAVDIFGVDSEAVSGFVVAKDAAASEAAYQAVVRAAYNGRIVRAEQKGTSKQIIGEGTYGASFTASGTYKTFVTRLDFEFGVHQNKATGSFAFRYGIAVDRDFVSLKLNTNIKGTLAGDAALLLAARNATSGNVLDTFLAGLVGTAKQLASHRETTEEQIGTNPDLHATLTLEFSENYQAKLTSANSILQCEVHDEIQHSGTRWVPGQIPDGISVVMNCGTQEGSRTISGSVIAATETAAMAYVKDVRQMAFPLGTGGGSTPSTRYVNPPRISRDFTFQPLTEGVPRGGDANFDMVKVDFSFAEILPDFPYVET